MNKIKKRRLRLGWKFEILMSDIEEIARKGAMERVWQFVDLIRDMHEVHSLAPSCLKLDREESLKSEAFARATDLLSKINSQFAEAKIRPVFDFPRGDVWHTRWQPWGDYGGPNGASELAWSRTIGQLVNLAMDGDLIKIHSCTRCGKPFLRRRVRHSFCSQTCRLAHHRASTKGKNKRSAYMRQYRKRLKTRDNNNLSAAKAKRGKRLR